MIGVDERPYTPEDLNVTKPILIKMVQRQMDKWPDQRFNPSKTKVDELKRQLLNAGFTKAVQVADDAGGGNAPELGRGQGGSLKTAASQNLTNALEQLENYKIELVIEDWRTQKGISPTILTVSMVPVHAHPNGELDIDANELLRKIQQSPASINGRVKLSFPDPINASYKRYFVKMNEPNIPLQDVPTSPEVLTVPLSRMFKVLVEHADDSGAQLHGTVSSGKRHVSEVSSLGNSERPLEKARRRSDEHGKGRSKDEQQTEQDAEKKDVEWLREQASTRPGYEEFCANRNRKLTNPERVKFWAFAAAFSNEHYRNFSGAQGQMGRRIKKKSISAVLGLGTTALAEAVNGTKIINIFNKGPRHSQEVVDALEKDEVQGSGPLLEFLVQWHKNHPTV